MMLSGAGMAVENPYKRPASPQADLPMPPAKIPKTGGGQLQINYLKREKKETIPLATADEPLPRLLRLISEYDGVLQRHESLAGNLGACPVGPILLKRFERLFEGPPRILKTNSRDPNITWLDVVEFAQNKPEQFDLEKTRNGIRVCQFYLKQCRVEISEEDYVLIRSGMPQKLIPPQPILEDEEKELGVIEVLDRNLTKIIHSADQVSARARQQVHKLKGRRTAIIARREAEGDAPRTVLRSNDHPPSPAFDHRPPPFSQQPPPPPPPQPQQQQPQLQQQPQQQSVTQPPTNHSPSIPSGGFTAVNSRHSIHSDTPSYLPSARDSHQIPESPLNGTPSHPPGLSHLLEQKPPTTQGDDWMNKFLTPSERAAGLTAETIRRESMNSAYRANSRESAQPPVPDDMRLAGLNARRQDSGRLSEGAIQIPAEQATATVSSADTQGPSVAIPNTPASLMPQQKPNSWNRDDGGPYKAEMISRMETMKRGERVIPPCDRCRRLHMDCIKNLTACLGCTKKHAKCSWKDVNSDELESTAPAARERAEKDMEQTAPSSSEWDNMLKQTKSIDSEATRESPTAVSTALTGEQPETPSNKASTPRAPSPPQNGTLRPSNHPPHESPKLDVRPPPLDQQLRDAAEERSHHSTYSATRYSPFPRPPSQHNPPHHSPHSSHSAPLPRDEDGGDRLAAIASQVYRSQSQNANRPNTAEPATS